MMNHPLSRQETHDFGDLDLIRRQTLVLATELGLGRIERLQVVSVVFALAHESIERSGIVRLEWGLSDDLSSSFAIRISAGETWRGDMTFSGTETARRLMDVVRSETVSGISPSLLIEKRLPVRSRPLVEADLDRINKALGREDPPSPLEQSLDQNREILGLLDELQARETELAETRRSIVGLSGALTERTDSLRRVIDMKTRFISNVSHQLRTPLSSILGLCHLLMDRLDGELSVEQERQVTFIHRAANDLTGIVNDLIDLARIEVGHDEVHVGPVNLVELFGSLRAMVRPLIAPGSLVDLIFEDPSGLPLLWTDEGKLATILRNLISNALKFTERGVVQLRASLGPERSIVFEVTDTGIGIESRDLDLIFEEFGQIEDSLRREPRGSGLGLPIVRKLTALLSGRIEVQSEPSVGSTFTASIPIKAVPSV